MLPQSTTTPRRTPTRGPHNSKPLAERLARRIDKSGGADACWPWLGGTTKGGYGAIMVTNTPRHSTTAHRIALELHEGRPLGPDEEALHTCDNPPCCNPKHLFRGTQQVNMDDMREKGRRGKTGPRGSGALTEASARAILRGDHAGLSQQQIADLYDVCQTTISRVLLRQTWKHIV